MERYEEKLLKDMLAAMEGSGRSAFEAIESATVLSQRSSLIDLAWIAIPSGNLILLLLAGAYSSGTMAELGNLGKFFCFCLAISMIFHMYRLLWRSALMWFRWGVLMQSLFLGWLVFFAID